MDNRITAGRSFLISDGLDLLRLAGPLIMAALLNMGIAITDVVMMGWLGAAELGAGAMISDYHSIVFYFTGGILAAAAPIIAHARGARDPRTVRRTVQQAMWLGLPLALFGALAIWFSPRALATLGVHPDIVQLSAPYARMISLAYAAMLLAMIWRHVLSAHDLTRVVFMITAAALPLNALGNYLLMFGKFGFPEMGLAGAGLSSFIVTLFVLIASMIYTQRHPELRRYRFFTHFPLPDWRRMAEFLRLGIPIGLSGLGETGVFLLATVAMGVIGPEALAAHAVALRTAGVIYAFPLGMSQAATVRIGFVDGRGDQNRLLRVARVAMLLAVGVGILYLIALLIWRQELTTIFIDAVNDPSVFALATLFIVILGISQPFECVGTIGAGALRGVKKTKGPMHASLLAFWGIGFITAGTLAFFLDWGGTGIWIGLAAGSAVFGLIISYQLYRTYQERIVSANSDVNNIATANIETS